MKRVCLDTLLVIVLGVVSLALVITAGAVPLLATAAMGLVATIIGGLLTALKSSAGPSPPDPKPQPETKP